MSDPFIFDRRTLRLRRQRAAKTIDQVQDVLADIAERLLDRLLDTKYRFTQALDLGGRGVIAPMLQSRNIHVISADLSPAMAARNQTACVCADEEFLPFADRSFDLIIANMSLHGVNDLPGALIQLRRALRPDGLFLASMPVLGTLSELRTALAQAETSLRDGMAARVAPFPDLRDCAGLLQRAGFALPVADLEEISLLYADPLALLRDLRAAGETNVTIHRDRRTPPRALFPHALALLPQKHDRIPISLKIGMLTGWNIPSQ